MPHGDLSDICAIASLAAGCVFTFAPSVLTQTLGPVGPLIDVDPKSNIPAAPLTNLVGAMLIMCSLTLCVVRWNTINGKYAGLGYLIMAVSAVKTSWDMDQSFVLRQWHLLALLFTVAALHLTFNPNEAWTSVTLAAREKERAARKAAKNK